MTLVERNRIAWEVYQRCWNQVVTVGMGEVIGLHIPALYLLMDTLRVPDEDRLALLDKLTLLHDTFFPVRKKESQGE